MKDFFGFGFDVLESTYGLHCSSFLGLPSKILIIYLVKPKKEPQWRLQVGFSVSGSGLKGLEGFRDWDSGILN